MGGSSFGSSNSHGNQDLMDSFKPIYNDLANKAMVAAAQGYVPFMGADVAAFNPTQVAGMQNANDWSAAFNDPGGKAIQVADSLPKSQDMGNGIQGISSYGGYMDQLEALKSKYPGLFNYITAQSINPVTGKPGKYAYMPNSVAEGVSPVAPGGTPGPGLGGLGLGAMAMAQPAQSREEALFGGGGGGGLGGFGGDAPSSSGNMMDWLKYAFSVPHGNASTEIAPWLGYQGTRPGLQASRGIIPFMQWGGSGGGVG